MSNAPVLRGLALPAVKAPAGYFASKSGGDLLWGDLMNALFVPVGGVVMNRSWGSAAHRLVFDPNTADLEDILAQTLYDAALAGAPHVRIHSITTRRDGRVLYFLVVFGSARGGEQYSRTAGVSLDTGGLVKR